MEKPARRTKQETTGRKPSGARQMFTRGATALEVTLSLESNAPSEKRAWWVGMARKAIDSRNAD